MYFSNIAGYSGSASRLGERPQNALRTARETLAKDFFETHPALERYRSLITPEHTPKLYEQMRGIERLRCLEIFVCFVRDETRQLRAKIRFR